MSHARDEGYSFLGPVDVDMLITDGLRTGTFAITARLRQGEGGAGAGSLVLPTGDRVPLGEQTLTVGRLPESTIVLADPNVSRNHAEIRPRGNGFVVVDLGSAQRPGWLTGRRGSRHDARPSGTSGSRAGAGSRGSCRSPARRSWDRTARRESSGTVRRWSPGCAAWKKRPAAGGDGPVQQGRAGPKGRLQAFKSDGRSFVPS